MRRLTLQIQPHQAGMRMETLLRRELLLSAADVRRAKSLPDGLLLDGKAVFTTAVVSPGQTLSAAVGDAQGSDQITPVPGPLDIVYEDEDLLVLNKAGGVPVHPSQGHHGDTLANFLQEHYRLQGLTAGFHPVNRLDRGTSGLMAVAKHAYAHQRLQAQLQSGTLGRRYFAVCQGRPPQDSGVIEQPIRRLPGSVLKRQVHSDGAWARTRYDVLDRGAGRSLLRLELDSGRTHQIRVHLAWLGCPLAGDFLYGTELPQLPDRFALHSAELWLDQPVTGAALHFQSPLPPALAALLQE